VDHHLNDDSEARLVIAETDPAGVAMLAVDVATSTA